VEPRLSAESQPWVREGAERESLYPFDADALPVPEAAIAVDMEWPRRKRELDALLASLDGC